MCLHYLGKSLIFSCDLDRERTEYVQNQDGHITVRRIFDAHFHGRDGSILKLVTQQLGTVAAYATYMPNLDPPIETSADVQLYNVCIRNVAPDTLTPIMTIYLTPHTTPRIIMSAREAGVRGAKLYPKQEGGGETTTNAGHGIHVQRSSLRAYHRVFQKMQEVGMILLLHGEVPWGSTLKRERRFLKILKWLVRRYPRLKMVLEHVTTRDAVQAVKKLPKTVAATITVHHLLYTLDDVVGDKICPHAFCKPIAKRQRDRRALIRAALSGNPKFFFGSDSAPHTRQKKECSAGCAGVYSAPVMLPLLAEIFERYNAISLLEDFTSKFGCAFYGLPRPKTTVTLERKQWQVPLQYEGIVPLYAGHMLQYHVMS